MLLSTQTQRLANSFGYEQAIKMLAKAGYDAFDLSLFHPLSNDDRLYKEDFREYAKELRGLADREGMICNQAHAPFPSSTPEHDKDDQIYKSILHAMEISSILGAKCIIVHPKQHLPYRANEKELKRINIEFYKSLIPYCEEFDINVAVENMWQHNPVGKTTIVNSTCARVEEFCEYIDEIDSERIVACLDIGHVSLCGEDMSVMIRGLGGKRLKALHVHDTDGCRDLHTLPFTANNDFPLIMKLLAEIGYEGDLTFEADSFFKNFPQSMYQDVAGFMQKTGRCLINMFEEEKSK
ncbi:MAG: sugar phosphate isomerase/epimerase [Clostridia bacterium]|nr:sugar phosphate isomerase/epimerase [Clostridia bacterium]